MLMVRKEKKRKENQQGSHWRKQKTARSLSKTHFQGTTII